MLRVLTFVALLVLGVVGVVAYLVVLPWISLPDEPAAEIDARWAEVEAWSAATPDSAGPLDELQRALASAQRTKVEVDAVDGPALARVDLDDDARAAIDQLVAWHDRGGGLGPDPCVTEADGLKPAIDIIRALDLAKLAIASADSPDDPAVVAAVHLGAALRGRGGALFGVVGVTIADAVRTRAVARGWPVTAALRAGAPHMREFFPIVARDVTCTVRLAERAVDEGELGEASGWRGLLQRRVGMERELTMLKWYEGRRLAAAHAVVDDPVALREALTHPPPEQLPRSLLIRGMAFDIAAKVDSFRGMVAAYDAFVRGSP
ncbi:MAG: hypothetical protein R3A79_24315 [Nannocystaceae bacterium]